MKKSCSAIKSMARENLFGKYGPIICATLIIAVVEAILTNAFSRMLMFKPGVTQYVIYFVASLLISTLVIFFQAGIYSMHLKASRRQPVDFKDFIFALKNEPNRFLIAGLILSLISFLYKIPSGILSEFASRYMISKTISAIPQLKNLYAAAGVSLEAYTDLPDTNHVMLAALLTLIGAVICIILMLNFSLVLFLMIDHPQMNAREAFDASRKHMRGNKLRLFGLMISFIGLIILGLVTLYIAFLWIIPYLKQTVVVFYEDVVMPDVHAQNESRHDPTSYYAPGNF